MRLLGMTFVPQSPAAPAWRRAGLLCPSHRDGLFDKRNPALKPASAAHFIPDDILQL